VKTIILAGGFGTRISEETEDKPKPMVLLGEKPILWHVMNIYATQGFDDFIIATGYKAEVIDNWVKELEEPWTVKALNTGLTTQTGGRVKRCIEIFPADRYFVTYGDGVGNVHLNQLLNFHLEQGRLATVTAVRPPARFGVLDIENNYVTHFGEKNQTDAGWINGGFFVFDRQIFSEITGDQELLETGPLPRLAQRRQLSAFLHRGFWKPMDTLREKRELEELIKLGNLPWITEPGQ